MLEHISLTKWINFFLLKKTKTAIFIDHKNKKQGEKRKSFPQAARFQDYKGKSNIEKTKS